jgi:hypothetical protein
MTPIPKLYVYGALLFGFLLYSVGLVWYGDVHGARRVRNEWQTSITAQAVADAQRIHASDVVTTQVITQYIDRYNVVLTQGATITREVTHVITPEVDRRYLVPTGLVRVLNASASGEDLDANAAGISNDTAASIAMSDVAISISNNYTNCRANAEQLEALQEWLREQAKSINGKGP